MLCCFECSSRPTNLESNSVTSFHLQEHAPSGPYAERGILGSMDYEACKAPPRLSVNVTQTELEHHAPGNSTYLSNVPWNPRYQVAGSGELEIQQSAQVQNPRKLVQVLVKGQIEAAAVVESLPRSLDGIDPVSLLQAVRAQIQSADTSVTPTATSSKGNPRPCRWMNQSSTGPHGRMTVYGLRSASSTEYSFLVPKPDQGLPNLQLQKRTDEQ